MDREIASVSVVMFWPKDDLVRRRGIQQVRHRVMDAGDNRVRSLARSRSRPATLALDSTRHCRTASTTPKGTWVPAGLSK